MRVEARPPRSGWPSWLEVRNISRIRLTKIKNRKWKAVTKRPPSAARRAFFGWMREIQISAGAFWKLHDKSPQSARRPLFARKRCAPCLLRLEILKGDRRNPVRHRLA